MKIYQVIKCYGEMEDRTVWYYKYDHDEDCWHEEMYLLGDYTEDTVCKFA